MRVKSWIAFILIFSVVRMKAACAPSRRAVRTPLKQRHKAVVAYRKRMLMCGKVTHKNLIDGSPYSEKRKLKIFHFPD